MPFQRVTFLRDDTILHRMDVEKFDLSTVDNLPTGSFDVSVVWVNEKGQHTSRSEIYSVGTREKLTQILSGMHQEFPDSFLEQMDCDPNDLYILQISSGHVRPLVRDLMLV